MPWIRSRDRIDIDRFGAEEGLDGDPAVNDDAIAKCISAAVANGITKIRVPNGIWNISSTIEMPINVELTFQGDSWSTFTQAFFGDALWGADFSDQWRLSGSFIRQTNALASGFTSSGIEGGFSSSGYWGIKDLAILGPGYGTGAAVFLTGAKNHIMMLDNLLIMNWSAGIRKWVSIGSQGWRRLLIRGCDVGLMIDGANTVTDIRGAAFERCHTAMLVENGSGYVMDGGVVQGCDRMFVFRPEAAQSGESGASRFKLSRHWFEQNGGYIVNAPPSTSGIPIGVVQSISGTTLTLATAADAKNFATLQLVCAADPSIAEASGSDLHGWNNDANTALQRASYAQVTSMNKATGTVIASTNWLTSIPDLKIGDYLYNYQAYSISCETLRHAGGWRGQIESISSDGLTITLTSGADARTFWAGMDLCASPDDGTSGSLLGSFPYEYVSVVRSDSVRRQLHLSTSIYDAIPGVATGNYLFKSNRSKWYHSGASGSVPDSYYSEFGWQGGIYGGPASLFPLGIDVDSLNTNSPLLIRGGSHKLNSVSAPWADLAGCFRTQIDGSCRIAGGSLLANNYELTSPLARYFDNAVTGTYVQVPELTTHVWLNITATNTVTIRLPSVVDGGHRLFIYITQTATPGTLVFSHDFSVQWSGFGAYSDADGLGIAAGRGYLLELMPRNIFWQVVSKSGWF